ncbi:MAG: cysteine--tRNA ligase [Waddliaceae bacterium]
MQAIENFPIQFFNTESRKKEVAALPRDRKITMYTCGPTVYNFAHIGNFRAYIFEDLLRRTLKYFNYQVEQVMNITDVDDKTINGANQNGVTLEAFIQPFEEAFFHDLQTLGIEKVEHYPKATHYIPQMITLIQTLLEKEVAYQGSDGSVYFAIDKFTRYGCLSHLNLDDLKSGASERVANDEYDKENASDFVLWKGYDEKRDGPIYWDSPFGKGRPGWHLECSTMAMEILGPSIDIHCGGVDNIFPHHENEIAQSEACTGKQFVKYWMHAEHLIVDGKKMSKSLGNFHTLRDLLSQGYTGREIRYMLLQTHYKTQLNFTIDELDAVKHSLNRLQDFIVRLKEVESQGDFGKAAGQIESCFERFSKGIADDLNISVSLAALFDLVREGNRLIDENQISQKEAEKVLDLLKTFNNILAVLQFEQEESLPENIQDLLDQRKNARTNKEWKRSDELRDQLQNLGYLVEDTPKGQRVKAL